MPEPRALTWFPVLRGIPAVVHGNWHQIPAALAPTLRNAPAIAPPARDDGLGSQPLPPLPAHLHQLCEEAADPAERALYAEALAALQMAWNVQRHASEEFWVAASFVWPVGIGEGFMRLLMRCEPRALILLAHYGAMFSRLSAFWWIGNRAREELDVIAALVGPRWALRWLGWVQGLVDGM